MENRIKVARIKAGLTQKKLSEWLNIPLSTIEAWDRGNRIPPVYVTDLIVEKIEQKNKGGYRSTHRFNTPQPFLYRILVSGKQFKGVEFDTVN